MKFFYDSIPSKEKLTTIAEKVKRTLLTLLLLFGALTAAIAQNTLSGYAVDSKTGEKIPFVNVAYAGASTAAARTDANGHFSVPFRPGKLRLSSIGYETRTFSVKAPDDSLVLRLKSLDNELGTATVVAKKEKYSRKNNPAVELMRKVIAAKKECDLHAHDYYSIDKYTKLTLALNEVTEDIFDDGRFKKMPFLKNHVETCNETCMLFLPLSVYE